MGKILEYLGFRFVKEEERKEETLDLEYWEGLNRRLDEELEKHINAPIESTILLPNQVAEMEGRKVTLESQTEELRLTLTDLQDEVNQLGGKPLQVLLREKKDLSYEIERLRILREELTYNAPFNSIVCSMSTPIGVFPSHWGYGANIYSRLING